MSSIPEPPDRWYRTFGEAARELGVERRTVANMVARGELETVRLSRRQYVLARSIRDYLDRVGAEPETNGTSA